MKATEFAYWMQGYFELTRSDAELTSVQVQQVFKKAQAVTGEGGNIEMKAFAFATYTQGILFPALHEKTATPEFLKSATKALRDRLNTLFEHAIDPSYDGVQNDFNNIHAGGSLPNKPVIRC